MNKGIHITFHSKFCNINALVLVLIIIFLIILISLLNSQHNTNDNERKKLLNFIVLGNGEVLIVRNFVQTYAFQLMF